MVLQKTRVQFSFPVKDKVIILHECTPICVAACLALWSRECKQLCPYGATVSTEDIGVCVCVCVCVYTEKAKIYTHIYIFYIIKEKHRL